MAITGIDTIEGKQIIAAGAVSAKSAEMAYNDENGNPITGYQVAGDYLTTADSANFYTTANESGFITGVPATYLQNTDLTISDGKVTEISGVPLSAGDEFPQSATDAIGYVTATSANIDSTIDNVSANSGVWGGSALPISAGLGIKVNLVDNTLVFSNDETVLFSGNLTGNGATAQLSEPIQNFERIKVYGHTDDGLNSPWFTEFYSDENTTMDVGAAANNAGWGKWFSFTITTEGLYTNVTGKVITFDSNVWGNLSNWGTTRVIGINRIAGGN